MSERTKAIRQQRKDERAALIRAAYRPDAMVGDQLRKLAGNAHVLSHHAADMEMSGSHAAAFKAHQKVADMHKQMAKGTDDYDSHDFPSGSVKSSEEMAAPHSDSPSSAMSSMPMSPSAPSSSPASSGAPSSAPESSARPSSVQPQSSKAGPASSRPSPSAPASSHEAPSSSEPGKPSSEAPSSAPSTPAGHKRVTAFIPK